MSIKIMTLVYESGLEKNLKAIALTYADHAQDDGMNVYPSVKRTSWKTGYSERSVQRLTKELVDSGILVPYGHGPNFTNRYRIDVKALPERPPWGGDILSPGCQPRQKGVTTTTEGGDRVTPQSSLIIKESKEDESELPIAELVRYFSEKSGKKTPNLSSHNARKFWLEPLIYIYKHHKSDFAETKRAIFSTIQYMHEEGLIIATPKSIRNIATAGKADRTGDYVGGVLSVATR